MIKLQFSLLLLVAFGIASAHAPSAATTREIASLFASLTTSGCEFNRNGTWYSAAKAADHLKRKYDYLLRKDLVDSAESFIARAAAESSRSGKAYQVRCPGKAALDSKAWFQNELLRYRMEYAQ